MKFVKCHFAIPEQFRGVRITSWRNLRGHMAVATFWKLAGEFEVPDWWLDRQFREQ